MFKQHLKEKIPQIEKNISADRKACPTGGCPLAATPLRTVMIAAGFFALLIGASCVTETNIDKTVEAAPPKIAPRSPAQVIQVSAIQPAAPVHLDGANFQPTVARGVTIVDFWAPWCGPCRRQLPILDNVAKTLGHEATIAKVNVDQNGQLARQYGIQSIPALLIFKDGRLIRRFTGVQQADTLVSAVKELN